MKRHAELPLDLCRQAVAVGVVQPDIERRKAPQHRRADPSRRDRPDLHPLQVVLARGAVGDVPAAVHHPLIGRDVVAYEREDHHHDVLGDADAVAVGDLGDRDPALDGGLQIDVVRSDSSRHGELQPGRLGDPLGRQVRRPERLGDHDLGLWKRALEDRVGTVLLRGDDQLVAAPLQKPAQPQLARDAPQQLAGREVDRLWRRRGLSVRDSARSAESPRAHRTADSRRPDRHTERTPRSPSFPPFVGFARAPAGLRPRGARTRTSSTFDRPLSNPRPQVLSSAALTVDSEKGGPRCR